MENPPFIADVPIKTANLVLEFPAMLDYQRVTIIYPMKIPFLNPIPWEFPWEIPILPS